MDFVCPKCKAPLAALDNVKRCPSGHSFDRAREGYYNLLLGVGGGTHGDNREMVNARREFLSRGHYLPLAERVAALALEHTPVWGCLLDAGCGEGYYTDIIENALYNRDGVSNVLGFDISRDAVRRAARKNSRLSLAVASSYDMPLTDGSVDTLVNVFSPLAIDETARVLKCGGHLLIVYPDRDHLYGLKSAIYKTPYKNEPQDTELQGFELALLDKVAYRLSLVGDDIKNLFMMTPYAYRTGKEDRERVLRLAALDTEVEFCLALYRKL